MTKPTLYVTGTECALYVDGKRESLGDPARSGWNRIDLSPAVRTLVRMAGVHLVENVDRRALIHDDPDHGPRWHQHQHEVEKRLGELAQAAELREAAAKAVRDAARLEESSR